jgi:6-pyruvoyltetrahydropterin/6-carboxytetrahydropterin synthase
MDALGRVVDFGVVKDLVGRWIDANLDHNMILHPDDPLLEDAEIDGKFVAGTDFATSLVGRLPFIMPGDMPNPTAENIAQVILSKAKELVHSLTAIQVCGIELYETPNCSVRIFDDEECSTSREDENI